MTEAPETWEDPPRRPPAEADTSPVLAVAGFEGPLDWLLELARTRRLDLRRLSILALVEAFGDAMTAALVPAPPVAELARWHGWMVMAAQLAELRSRLMLPAEDPRAQAGQVEAEALRRQVISRAEMVAVADWLERQPQLGRDVFACGRPEAGQTGARRKGQGAAHRAVATFVDDADEQDGAGQDEAGQDDLTELLRACLVVLRLPARAEAYQPRRLPFWSVADATTRISRMLRTMPEGGVLDVFLPALPEHGPEQAGPEQTRASRAALAATLVAGLEMARSGGVTLQQEASWTPIRVA